MELVHVPFRTSSSDPVCHSMRGPMKPMKGEQRMGGCPAGTKSLRTWLPGAEDRVGELYGVSVNGETVKRLSRVAHGSSRGSHPSVYVPVSPASAPSLSWSSMLSLCPSLSKTDP